VAKLRVAIIAGEASGDILGAGIIAALKTRYSDVEFYGIGGELMIEQGLISKVPMEQLSVMGLVEVLSRLPSLLKLRRDLIAEFICNPPDVFIGIDAPDFNLNIELALKKAGILTVHYVSPSVWAWKKKRIFKIKAAVDLLLCLFPFEAKHYRETQQKLAFVGHPLAKIIPHSYDAVSVKKGFGYREDDLLVALMPGSRGSEIKYLLPVFLETAKRLYAKYPKLKFILPAANQYRFDEIQQQLLNYADLPIQLVLKCSREAMSACDSVLIASGTATLEAALLRKPMVVAYKMSSLTYAIYSRMIKAKFVSLPNLLADQLLVPELLQQQAVPEVLIEQVEKSLFDCTHRELQQQKFKEIHQLLDLPASELAAQAVETLLKRSPELSH